jgi:hypothetical protein
MALHADTPRSYGDRDAPHLSPAYPSEDLRTVLINRVAWGAVMAGVVVALITQIVLNMLGIGIGAATLDPMTGDNPDVRSFSIGAAAWWTVSGVIAAFCGGYVAGRLSGKPKEGTAGWHGLTSWALTMLIVFAFFGSAVSTVAGGAMRVVGGTAEGVGRTVSTAAQTAAPALQGKDPFAAVEQQVRESVGGNDPGALRDAAVTAMRAALTGDPSQAQAAREKAAETLARAQNISIDEALSRVAQYEQQYRQAVDQAKQSATQAADTAAKVTSRGALLGVLALVLGALASWFGGRAGAVDPTLTDTTQRLT